MTTSTTKLIAIFTLAGLLTANAAMAKSPGKMGGNGGNGVNHVNGSLLNKQLSTSFVKSNPIQASPIKKDFAVNKFNNSGFKLDLKKNDSPKPIKDFGKKDSHCFDKSCYWNKCSYPWYIGCYDYCYPKYCSPTYCYPTYGLSSYGSSLTVLPSLEASRTRVALGSILMLNGQAFGDRAGGARLRISGMALPIEVIEWTPSAVKVRLPQFELTSITPAEIEVLRADGSLASKSAVELTPAPAQLALGQ